MNDEVSRAFKMNIINATPPLDFPEQCIMMDKDLGTRHPDKTFYLRIAIPNGVDHVDLDGAITPVEARRMAREKGYEPTHWMEINDTFPMMF